ncbi:protein IMPACT isoform X2 [Lethenteron reissneri]|uniref:protein IMPACT isoform X2 n=1 Tax=Lethenteron reissneri TaxID=7753 RepID=UPI002AB74ED6|nr:protein IMPACT isoform X2 [Lethenteron reissneri]
MASAEDDISRQADEVEAMSSIYGDEWCTLDEAARSFCISVGNGQDPPRRLSVSLQMTLPADYPGQAPPSYQLNGPWLTREDKRTLSARLEEIYSQNLGESVLFLWVECIREFVADASERSQPAWNTYRANQTEEDSDLVEEMLPTILNEETLRSRDLEASDEFTGDEVPPIVHGETITDRRSTFQAHVAPVVTTKQVKLVLRKLLENKKLASATHNIMAYRIDCPGKHAFLQDCDDDGETAAGGRLLHLLQILDVRDAVVVVSRWYGGVMLGPDRFKHINNCARGVLVENGFVQTAQPQRLQWPLASPEPQVADPWSRGRCGTGNAFHTTPRKRLWSSSLSSPLRTTGRRCQGYCKAQEA